MVAQGILVPFAEVRVLFGVLKLFGFPKSFFYALSFSIRLYLDFYLPSTILSDS